MNKYEIATHMANLTFIMDFHEKLGTAKNPLIVADFHSHHNLLVATLEKENEARQAKLHRPTTEA